MAVPVNGQGAETTLSRDDDLHEWHSVLAGFPHRHCRAGAELLRQGTSDVPVVALCAGLLKLIRAPARGRDTIVGLRRRGSILGAASALLGVCEPLTVVAVTPCDVIEVPPRKFASLVARGGPLSWRVHLEHCRELGRELEHTAGLASLPARDRFEQFLDFLGGEIAPFQRNGHLPGIEIPLLERELAQLLGITRQYMSRLIGELESEGRLLRGPRRWNYLQTGRQGTANSGARSTS